MCDNNAPRAEGIDLEHCSLTKHIYLHDTIAHDVFIVVQYRIDKRYLKIITQHIILAYTCLDLF